MARRQFSLVFDPEVKKHLRAIEAKYHSLIRTTIEEQLTFEPLDRSEESKTVEAAGGIWSELGITVRAG